MPSCQCGLRSAIHRRPPTGRSRVTSNQRRVFQPLEHGVQDIGGGVPSIGLIEDSADDVDDGENPLRNGIGMLPNRVVDLVDLEVNGAEWRTRRNPLCLPGLICRRCSATSTPCRSDIGIDGATNLVVANLWIMFIRSSPTWVSCSRCRRCSRPSQPVPCQEYGVAWRSPSVRGRFSSVSRQSVAGIRRLTRIPTAISQLTPGR